MCVALNLCDRQSCSGSWRSASGSGESARYHTDSGWASSNSVNIAAVLEVCTRVYSLCAEGDGTEGQTRAAAQTQAGRNTGVFVMTLKAFCVFIS